MVKASRLFVFSAILAAVLGARSVAGQSPQTAAAPLPDAKDVIARFVAAIGGADAQMSIKSLRARGTCEVPSQMVSGTVEILEARPFNLLLNQELKAIGHVETGYNGTIGWSLDSLTGPALLTGKELTELRDDADFDGLLHLPGRVAQMTTMARAEFDGRPALKVKVVFTSGNEQMEFFDVETGFQIGTETQRDNVLGTTAVTEIMRDYKKFGRLFQPTTLIERSMGIDQVTHITSFEYDVVPATAFDPPPAIKALIK